MKSKTTKRKRKYGQDFSEATHGRITDSSFAPACDVNNIVAHYQKTGIDPYVDRIALARFQEASTISFEDAMRHKADLDTAFAEQPLSVRAEHDNSAIQWYESLATQNTAEVVLDAPEPPPAEPPPEDASPDNSEGKVQ